MARIFPTYLPDSATPGERAMLAILRKLDDDCLVFFEPGVANRRPDFVVIMPGVGLMVIEVKDWEPATLREASPHQITLAGAQGPLRLTHPEEQARQYAYRLARSCRSDAFGRMLIQRTGPYQGKLCFPVAGVAAYPNMSRQTLDETGFLPCFPPAHNVTSDVLAQWRRLSGAELAGRLRAHFDARWDCGLSPEQVEILTSLIYPIRVASTSRRASDELRLLDGKQRELACFIHPGHRILRGVSGSGKTVILIARAKLLAENPQSRVLILCYNKLLRDFIADEVEDLKNVEVRTFHKWCARNRVDYRAHHAPDALGAALRQEFEDGRAPDAARFDAVLVDEAQLMSCDWLACARLALKEADPHQASLLVAADGAQSLNKLIRFNWKDAGIAASGRTTILSDNYRNTKEIVSVAEGIMVLRQDIGGPSDPARADPAKCRRNGPLPELRALGGRDNECDYAASLVRTWLLAGRGIRGRLVRPAPEDVAIIYPHRARGAGDFAHRLRRALAPTPLAVLSGADTANLSEPGVRLLSMKKALGLQFPFVILLWTDLLPSGFADQDDNALLYMAMTRAEDVLVMLHSGGSELVSRIASALEASGAPALN
jgi:hypothetical protein